MPVKVLSVRTVHVKVKNIFLSPESGGSEGLRRYLKSYTLVSQVTAVGRGRGVAQVPFGPWASSPSHGNPDLAEVQCTLGSQSAGCWDVLGHTGTPRYCKTLSDTAFLT